MFTVCSWPGRPAIIIAAAAMLGTGLVANVVGQQPSGAVEARTFEAASIKLHPALEQGGTIIANGSTFRAIAVTTRALVIQAFAEERRLLRSQVLGGPSWIDSDRYDVIARADGSLNLRSAALPLRRTLEERFQLKAHKETREQTVYALTRRPGGRPLGPGLKPSTVDCSTPGASRRPNPAGWCGGNFGDTSIEAGAYTLPGLATSLSGMLQLVVLDETNLAGPFDITLKWSQDASGSADDPSIFAAVEEQLGLKLEPRKANVDVLVIDRIERPTPD